MNKTAKMGFGGFSDETEQFLWGIALNNERTWFNEHKQEYLDNLYVPLTALSKELYKKMSKTMNIELVTHVSRIYRDARRLHGRGPYKDKLWLSLREPLEDWTAKPTFYFEIGREGGMYGMGCYYDRPYAMELFRKRATAAPAEIERLVSSFNEQKIFTLEGEEYKKSKGDTSDILRPWYQKKYFDFCRYINWGRSLKSKNLPQKICTDFLALKPLYEYFDKMSADIMTGDPIEKTRH